jgi:ATP-dependent Clp protease ATP-binding subunit ClpB
MKNIAKTQLAKLSNRLMEKEYLVEFSENLTEYLANKGFDPVYGARPLKRLIQREAEDLLAGKIIMGEIPPNKKITMDYDEGKGVFLEL